MSSVSIIWAFSPPDWISVTLLVLVPTKHWLTLILSSWVSRWIWADPHLDLLSSTNYIKWDFKCWSVFQARWSRPIGPDPVVQTRPVQRSTDKGGMCLFISEGDKRFAGWWTLPELLCLLTDVLSGGLHWHEPTLILPRMLQLFGWLM